MASSDFDGDGILDLAVACYGSDDVGVFLGQGAGGRGDGTFAPRVDYVPGSGPNAIVTGDVRIDGRIEVCGQPWVDGRTRVPPEERRVGYLPQGYGLFPHLTALNNVAYGVRGTRPERRRLAAERLELEQAVAAWALELFAKLRGAADVDAIDGDVDLRLEGVPELEPEERGRALVDELHGRQRIELAVARVRDVETSHAPVLFGLGLRLDLFVLRSDRLFFFCHDETSTGSGTR